MCLNFEGSDSTKKLAGALEQAHTDLAEDGRLLLFDKRLPLKKSLAFLTDDIDGIRSDRYEWYLYLQTPNRLNGQLTIPEVIKYRSLQTDLVDDDRWKEQKEELLEQTQLPKLKGSPNKLIERMAMELDTQLHEVSNSLEQDDSRNVIMHNRSGKQQWRLPTSSPKHLVNNPFFQQMPPIGIADVLRMVDQDTGFIGCFEHVLGVQSKS